MQCRVRAWWITPTKTEICSNKFIGIKKVNYLDSFYALQILYYMHRGRSEFFFDNSKSTIVRSRLTKYNIAPSVAPFTTLQHNAPHSRMIQTFLIYTRFYRVSGGHLVSITSATEYCWRAPQIHDGYWNFMIHWWLSILDTISTERFNFMIRMLDLLCRSTHILQAFWVYKSLSLSITEGLQLRILYNVTHSESITSLFTNNIVVRKRFIIHTTLKTEE